MLSRQVTVWDQVGTQGTDRIGDKDYNFALSERRADSVSTYLISRNVPGNRISTMGRGDTEPQVFCEGNRVTEEMKRCLQPNRRVHITITDDRE
jgi:outer membrane protein OmpA-like peptidoglycan-associated protein